MNSSHRPISFSLDSIGPRDPVEFQHFLGKVVLDILSLLAQGMMYRFWD
jgi:hypothetical protein